jgi:uncharacterized SAM-dependent methyltransferase
VIRREKGGLYMPNKKERALPIEVLKMTFGFEAGRECLLERSGKQGLKIAVSLLEEMGVQIGGLHSQN